MAAEPIMVYINDELLINGCPVDSNYSVTSTGLRIMRNGNLKAEWTYSGSNQFLGFSTTQDATTAEYEVGSTGYLYDMQAAYQGLYLYSVEMVSKLVDNIALSEFLTKSKQLFYYASNPPPYPVTSVNGLIGAVTVTVPTKTSDLTNDSGFTTNTGTITKVSVNGTTVATTGAANITSIPASIINGTITNTQLANNKITIAGNDVSLGGTLAADTLRISLGLSNAMHFKGTTTTALTDGTTTAAITINSASYTPSAGDVVLYNNKEFVWTGSLWELLGDEGSYKVKQSAVSSPTANGNTTAFIDTISQDANGVISVTKKNLDTSGTWNGNATTATTASKLGSSNLGSTTKPIYLDSGTATECSTYAGGTAVTLNNSSKAASTASFYAPTTGGTQNTQALIGNGATAAPKWVNISPSISVTAGTASAAPKINVTVLGQSGTAQSITTATTGLYGVTKLNSATNSTSTSEAATPSAVKSAYDLANNHKYWANMEATSAATYNKTPEMATIKLNGNTNASAASTSNVTLVFDTVLQALNFVFA